MCSQGGCKDQDFSKRTMHVLILGHHRATKQKPTRVLGEGLAREWNQSGVRRVYCLKRGTSPMGINRNEKRSALGSFANHRLRVGERRCIATSKLWGIANTSRCNNGATQTMSLLLECPLDPNRTPDDLSQPADAASYCAKYWNKEI